MVPGEVEELKVTVGLCGEGQVELDMAIWVHSDLWPLVLPVRPEPVGEKHHSRDPAPSLKAEPHIHPAAVAEEGGERGASGPGHRWPSRSMEGVGGYSLRASEPK